jgi:hypothetical protein
VDINLAGTGLLVFVLSDEEGPVDVSAAALSCVVIGPKPGLSPRAGVPVPSPVPGRVGHVAMSRGGWLTAGWLGFLFTAQWGADTKVFPSRGSAWLLAG